MRKPPPPPASTKRRTLNEDVRTYRFLTYVFGGGVKVREHQKFSDPVTPIRVSSIRGQLRFWWRACNPSKCRTIEELHQREAEIWGSTSKPSQVIVEVISQPSVPQKVEVYTYREREDGKKRLVIISGMREIAYGAFPLQPSNKAKAQMVPPGALFNYGDSSFTVRFLYPDELEIDVRTALWAWEMFGGLGGRTRRGFGAIAKVGSHSDITDVINTLKGYQDRPLIPGVPSLAGSQFGQAPQIRLRPLESWKDGLGLLQKIRQGSEFGRNPSSDPKKPAGRSRWPEADEIRSLTGAASHRHRSPNVSVPRFPRAAFGLPIVFHFMDPGDPDMDKIQLQPEQWDRLASPLIIRPLPEKEGFRTTALVLNSEIPSLTLIADDRSYSVRHDLDAAQAVNIKPLNRGKVFTDPIKLFLSELEK